MTVICQKCKEFTACKCPNFIKYAPENTFGPISTIEETIPSPLSDYYLDIIKDYQPMFPLPEFTPDPAHIQKKRALIDFAWREHIENTFKCPNGHVVELGSGYGGEINVYCRGDDCDYNKFGVEL